MSKIFGCVEKSTAELYEITIAGFYSLAIGVSSQFITCVHSCSISKMHSESSSIMTIFDHLHSVKTTSLRENGILRTDTY